MQGYKQNILNEKVLIFFCYKKRRHTNIIQSVFE